MINYWYRTSQSEDHKAWYVEILANSDLIGSRAWGAMEQPTDLRILNRS